MFYTEIQVGRQKWQENNFCASSPADSMWVKNIVEIALARSISEINAFLHLTQKFKMAAKSQIPCGSKILSKLLYLAPFKR